MRSMIRSAVAALALSPLVAVADAQQAAAPKIAYVRSQAILEAAPGRADAEAQFEKEMAGYRKQVQVMGDSLNAMIAAYQKAEATLSAADKEKRQQAIQQKQGEYAQRAQQIEQQAAQRQQELVQPILNQVTELLDAMRQELGYALILDAQAGVNYILSADKNLDLTDRVIARLKAMKPATAAKPAGAPMNAAPAGVQRPKN